ncbi:unnamed protein product, partial [Discosporangium mesarthrocarpum]
GLRVEEVPRPRICLAALPARTAPSHRGASRFSVAVGSGHSPNGPVTPWGFTFLRRRRQWTLPCLSCLSGRALTSAEVRLSREECHVPWQRTEWPVPPETRPWPACRG